MTLDIPALRRLRDAATPLPYDVRPYGGPQVGRQTIATVGSIVITATSNCEMATMEDDAAYACAAANAVPALCDEIERLRAELDAVTLEREGWRTGNLAGNRRIEKLEAALRWALPLAESALESVRQERNRAGHTDIVSVRRGIRIAGLWQDEVDQAEAARAALEANNA